MDPEAVVEAMKHMSSTMDDASPSSMGPIAWTPTLEDLRAEIGMKPSGLLEVAIELDPFEVVAADLDDMSQRMIDMVCIEHPLLSAAATHLFAQSGKRFRATMVLLVARACGGSVSPRQARLADIVEMIHTASLFHDDVIDGASSRRGLASVNAKFGDKVAILAGDFLLARACLALAQLRDLDVVEVLATVIEHLVRGEITQMRPDLGEADLLERYLAKNFYKTGSLMANGCRASAMLRNHASATCDAAFKYGRHLGLAFQLIDDVLDFTGTDFSLGKPALNDLRQGIATAPTLFAARDQPSLLPLIQRKFALPGDVDAALALLANTDAIQRTTHLATVQAELAQQALTDHFPPSPARDALLACVPHVYCLLNEVAPHDVSCSRRLAAKVVTRRH